MKRHYIQEVNRCFIFSEMFCYKNDEDIGAGEMEGLRKKKKGYHIP